MEHKRGKYKRTDKIRKKNRESALLRSKGDALTAEQIKENARQSMKQWQEQRKGLTCWISAEMYAELKQIASDDGCSINGILNELIARYVKRKRKQK